MSPFAETPDDGVDPQDRQANDEGGGQSDGKQDDVPGLGDIADERPDEAGHARLPTALGRACHLAVSRQP